MEIILGVTFKAGLGKMSVDVHQWTAKQFAGDCLNNK